MNRDIYLTDKTALELRGASPEGLVQFLDLVLGTGITEAEVHPFQLKFLKDRLSVEKLAVWVETPAEAAACRRMGAARFVTNAESYLNGIDKMEIPDLTVEIRANSVHTFLTDTRRAEQIRDVKIRIAGIPDVFSDDYKDFFSRVFELFGDETSADFSNRLFCATAAAFEWIHSGGVRICASFTGVGHRACAEELLAALNVIDKTGFSLLNMPEIRNVYEKLTDQKVEDFKPVAGRNIFAFESGIHADGIFKNPINYEPFMPESVGNRRRLVIGKHSGRQALNVKLSELRLAVDKRHIDEINDEVRRFAIRMRRALRDDEIKAICENVISQGGAYEG